MRAMAGGRVEDDWSCDTGEVDAEQVWEDDATVDPRNERVAITLNAARLVVEDLAPAERPSKHVGVVQQQWSQSVNDNVNSIHHHCYVYL